MFSPRPVDVGVRELYSTTWMEKADVVYKRSRRSNQFSNAFSIAEMHSDWYDDDNENDDNH